MNKIYTLCVCFLVIFVHIECKIGRGGGGGGYRSAGSRINSRLKPLPPRPGGYNSRGGIRWASFGAGMAAYGIMSSLINRGHYHPGYYSRPEYRSQDQSGSLCVNNEDFNGTKFGSFYCPLPGFNPSAKYCCGSVESESQYCCEYFDDEGRKNGFIIAILCGIGLIVCLIGCGIRVYLTFKKRNSFPKSLSTYGQIQNPNIRNINRNFTSGPKMGPSVRTPQQTQQQQQSMPYQNAPYPTTQPLMPPSYTDAVKN